jgi:hypothetical protein
MHAFVPHVHSHQDTAVVIEIPDDDTDVFQMLTRSLSFNLGYHHLENYRDAGHHDIFNLDHWNLQFIEMKADEQCTLEEYPRPVHEYLTLCPLKISRDVNRGPPVFG